MDAIRSYLGTHGTALRLREERNEVLASNIANAATPGFKARDFDFQARLHQELGEGNLRTTNTQHFTSNSASVESLVYRQPTNPSLDGNTVELNVEQMEFSENTLRYQTSLELINRRLTGLMMAIRGE